MFAGATESPRRSQFYRKSVPAILNLYRTAPFPEHFLVWYIFQDWDDLAEATAVSKKEAFKSATIFKISVEDSR
jgi:hypothetical protein